MKTALIITAIAILTAGIAILALSAIGLTQGLGL
jgi:hypothetical protein